MTPTPANLASRIQHAIGASGRSQKEVALAIGLDATKLSKGLNQRRRFKPREIEQVAEFLGLDAAWLRTGAAPAGPAPRASDPQAPLASPEPAPDGTALDRRTAILDAAGRLIARKGYHNVRMQDVASDCGVSTAAVHYHFASRDLLLVSAMEYVIGQDFQRNSAALASVSTSLERLELFVDLLLPDNDVMRDDWSLWLQFWTERITNEKLRTLYNEFHAQWLESVTHLVRRGQQRGEFAPVDAAQFAATFVALADGLALRVLTRDPEVTPATMRTHLVTLIHDRLLPR
ncbi:TetR family transcriptional regulator C-terminal domain-containing protein [Micrococcales bacterium 31B]|nr:TetR family transcriptional regulator C-terminal domain-containing protein [Micrococcales bacterium 31B]